MKLYVVTSLLTKKIALFKNRINLGDCLAGDVIHSDPFQNFDSLNDFKKELFNYSISVTTTRLKPSLLYGVEGYFRTDMFWHKLWQLRTCRLVFLVMNLSDCKKAGEEEEKYTQDC